MANDTIPQYTVEMQPPVDAEIVCVGIGHSKRIRCVGRGSGPGRSTILQKNDLLYIQLPCDLFAVVDVEDFDLAAGSRWYLAKGSNSKTHYVGTNTGKQHQSTLMHRRILSAEKGQSVDHINGNGLDNRRMNLRLCTHSENMKNLPRNSKNITGHRGVSFHMATGRYIAQIWCDNRHHWLGRHDTIEEARAAYAEAAKRLHKEFARP